MTANVKDFAQIELGCQCEDDVFDYIIVKENQDLPSTTLTTFENIKLFKYINVGHRLLIYIVNFDDYGIKFENNPSLMDELVKSGRQVREDNRMNRFRLILFSRELDSPILQNIKQNFYNLDSFDENTHLHIIDSEVVMKYFK